MKLHFSTHKTLLWVLSIILNLFHKSFHTIGNLCLAPFLQNEMQSGSSQHQYFFIINVWNSLYTTFNRHRSHFGSVFRQVMFIHQTVLNLLI